jgi:hypothetical protein
LIVFEVEVPCEDTYLMKTVDVALEYITSAIYVEQTIP